MDEQDGEPQRARTTDWAGLSVFVLSVCAGLAVLIGVTAEALRLDGSGDGSGVIVSAVTAILGAMVGAVSTYAGLGRTPRPRHQRQ